MAPALVEIPQQTSTNAKSGAGEYKEAYIGGPKAYRLDAELKGTAKQPPAKYPHYLPTWDAEKKSVTCKAKIAGVMRLIY